MMLDFQSIKLLKVGVFGCIFGQILEKMIYWKNIPFLNLYGSSAIIITLILDNFPELKTNYTLFAIVVCALIALSECIGGKLSMYFTNKDGWHYDKDFITFCDGHVSVVTTLFFTFFFFLYLIFVYPRVTNQLCQL